MDLNLLANHLLLLGGTVVNVNIFVNNTPIHIVDLGMGGEHDHFHDYEHFTDHDHMGIIEGQHPDMHHPDDWTDPYAYLENHPHYTLQQMQEHLDELSEALHQFDDTLHEIHEESEHMVEDYHHDLKELEDELIAAKDAIDREYMPKF